MAIQRIYQTQYERLKHIFMRKDKYPCDKYFYTLLPIDCTLDMIGDNIFGAIKFIKDELGTQSFYDKVYGRKVTLINNTRFIVIAKYLDKDLAIDIYNYNSQYGTIDIYIDGNIVHDVDIELSKYASHVLGFIIGEILTDEYKKVYNGKKKINGGGSIYE